MITKKESCANKKTFYNYNDANSVLGQLRKGSLSLYQDGYVYECNICGWYHITTNLKNYQKKIIRKIRFKRKTFKQMEAELLERYKKALT